MELTKAEGKQVVYDDHEDWEEVKGTREIIDNSRWSIVKSAVFLHKPSGKHYSMFWSQGATEQQDESPFEYDDPELTEVEAKSVTVTKWMPVEPVSVPAVALGAPPVA